MAATRLIASSVISSLKSRKYIISFGVRQSLMFENNLVVSNGTELDFQRCQFIGNQTISTHVV